MALDFSGRGSHFDDAATCPISLNGMRELGGFWQCSAALMILGARLFCHFFAQVFELDAQLWKLNRHDL